MYKLLKNTRTGNIESVVKIEDNILVTIPFDSDNTDYQEYLKWLSEGNQPLPADEPQEP